MRAAPAVEITLGAGRREHVLVMLMHLGAAAAVLAWGLSWGWPLALAAAGAVLLVGAAWRAPRGRLGWDGQAWQLTATTATADGAAPQPLDDAQLVLDLGGWLLLKLLRPGRAGAGAWAGAWITGAWGSAWCGVTSRDAGPQWPALRAALYASRGRAP